MFKVFYFFSFLWRWKKKGKKYNINFKQSTKICNNNIMQLYIYFFFLLKHLNIQKMWDFCEHWVMTNKSLNQSLNRLFTETDRFVQINQTFQI